MTEAAIDAMSLAAIEGMQSRHALSQHRRRLVAGDRRGDPALAIRPGTQLVAATDDNKQGDVYAGRLLALAGEVGCGAERLRPVAATGTPI